MASPSPRAGWISPRSSPSLIPATAARAAQKIAEKEPFDVLVVGGGPAGASAAIYAARKGIRTGVVAERFGGQVLDTMGIENFISVSHTEGPKLAAGLEQHVRAYEVDIMAGQKAAELIPAASTAVCTKIKLASGASLAEGENNHSFDRRTLAADGGAG